MIRECKHCGTKNRIGEIPHGKVAVCGTCRNVLGQVDSPKPRTVKRRISGAVWAWAGIIGIGLLAWLISASGSLPSKRSAHTRPSDSRSNTHLSSKQKPSVRPAFSEPEMTAPASGEVRTFTSQKRVAPLQIRSSSGDNYLVKLADATTGQPVLLIYVRGGQTEEIDVPIGTYRVKYASGDRWYGYTHLFGPDTQYSKADQPFTFTFDGNQYSGYTVTLYKVQNGNLRTSKISSNDF